METQPEAWLRRLKDYRDGIATVAAWRRFGREVRQQGCRLLRRLGDYPDAILVAGCQRSGTTMLARLITGSEGMVNYYFGVDDEHDAAMLLSGEVGKPCDGRFCFQTTYLNECYLEYVTSPHPFKLIWVVRNPYSVVHSFLYNWSRFALNELFWACGRDHLTKAAALRYRRFGLHGVSRLERACCAYAGKSGQVIELKELMPEGKLMVVDYDRLVREKNDLLPKIYQFIGLPYRPEYADKIHGKSLDKASNLSTRERKMIECVCVPVYEQTLKLVDA